MNTELIKHVLTQRLDELTTQLAGGMSADPETTRQLRETRLALAQLAEPAKPWVVDYDDYGDELWFGGEGQGLFRINVSRDVRLYTGGDCHDAERKATLTRVARLVSYAPVMLDLLRQIDDERSRALVKEVER